ncbi:hypothetical protein GGX14DRAFT_402981 [Mycena pura]|uniref:Uncharacterized protein n=1 Tax=Mycena pura TaxID=153505 RepID=A0AAD6UWS2_9AGAR|nr:hypothetical protein GGX14DRAFT_402981 [Mycena pura]
MHLGVPGLVLHEFTPGEENVPSSLLSDFWEDSTSSGETIPYDSVRGSISSESPILLDDRGSAPLLSREELWMSSSWFAQGPRRAGDPLPPIVVPSPPPPAPLPSPPPPRREFRIVGMQYWPSNQEPPSRNRVDPASGHPSDDVDVCMGKMEWGRGIKAYFLRALHRRPYIVGHDIPDGVWDLRNFGLPVPEGDFFVESGNHWLRMKRSQWMYMQEKPSKDMPAGTVTDVRPRREAPSGPSMTLAPDPILVESPVPVADEVSRLASPPVVGRENTPNEPPEPAPAQEEEREEPSASSNGKGKAKATEEDEEMTSPAEREEGEVEERREAFSSTVIVLYGLYEQGIMVYSAMNGQRRTWLQFFDLEAAGRALTALPTAGASQWDRARALLLNAPEPHRRARGRHGTQLPVGRDGFDGLFLALIIS